MEKWGGGALIMKREAGKYTIKKVNSSKDAPKNHKKTYHYLPKNTYTAC